MELQQGTEDGQDSTPHLAKELYFRVIKNPLLEPTGKEAIFTGIMESP